MVVRHRSLTVYVSPDAYVFEPAPQAEDGQASDKAPDVMVLDRLTGSISLNPPNRAIPLSHEAVHTVHGVLGVVSLSQTDYVILIKTVRHHARFLGHDVFAPTSFLTLPLAPSSSSGSGSSPSSQEAHLLALVQLALDTTTLLFSHTYDLTSSLQRQARGEGVDERFFWNYEITRRFVEAGTSGRKGSVIPGGAASGGDLASFVLPVICGSFDLRSVALPSAPPFHLLLLSRRSHHRPGTRYFRRGIDAEGHVANFVETEQILVTDRAAATSAAEKSAEAGVPLVETGGEGQVKCSFVQIRGSAPVFWAQINNLRYVPDLLVMDLPSTTDALRAHLAALQDAYSKVHLVNLVNQVAYERPVKEAFENALLVLGADGSGAGPAEGEGEGEGEGEKGSRTRYWYWDFHKECKGMRFERVEGLVGKLKAELDDEGWFQWEAPIAELADGRRPPRKTQTSVVRTNCMDSLDRTNVVQSALARSVLDAQLRSLGLLGANDSILHHPSFLSAFRNAWADHADAVSTHYSGTGALKTDFTRTGKRSFAGALEDGRRSVLRYWKNNFRDGERQDALDLITGSWRIRRGTPSPFEDDRPFVVQVMPYILTISLFLLLAGLYSSLPEIRTQGLGTYLHLPVLALVAALSGAYVWANGIQYVDRPRLTPTPGLAYTGPGYRTRPRGRGLPHALASFPLPLLRRSRTAAAPSAAGSAAGGVAHWVDGASDGGGGGGRLAGEGVGVRSALEGAGGAEGRRKGRQRAE